MRRATAAMTVAAALIAAADGSRATAGPYDAHERGINLRYVNEPAPEDDITAPPRLRISFGGRSYHVVMDTGSTGIVVSAEKFPNLDALPTLAPGRLVYSSSGKVMLGRWVETPVTISGANGAAIVTEPMPVLAVERVECLQRARNCEERDAPRGISMMGIGFGRTHDGQQQSGPDKNPFLRVATILNAEGVSRPAAGMRRGYVVTRRSVHVGLTRANTRGEFGYVPLRRGADGDWAETPACIAVNGGAPACGTLLMDTGVTTMFLTIPDAPVTGRPGHLTLETGTAVDITIPTGGTPRAAYGFKVDDEDNPLTPSKLHFIRRDRAPFVNTGVHFLNGFDYLFDADGGQVGFRWTGHADTAIGRVSAGATD